MFEQAKDMHAPSKTSPSLPRRSIWMMNLAAVSAKKPKIFDLEVCVTSNRMALLGPNMTSGPVIPSSLEEP